MLSLQEATLTPYAQQRLIKSHSFTCTLGHSSANPDPWPTIRRIFRASKGCLLLMSFCTTEAGRHLSFYR